MAHVIVNIDKARRDVELGDVHNFPRLIRGYVFFDGCNLALKDCDVTDFINVIGRINHMAALKQQVIARRLGEGCGES